MRNTEMTYSACPVIGDKAVRAYLSTGAVPPGAHYQDVPPNKVIRQRGFWFVPSYRAHAVASLFLISTDVYAMNADQFEAVRAQEFCYYSEKSGIHYLGSVSDHEPDFEGVRVLMPMTPDQHPPILLSDLVYVGRVISAM